MAGRWCLRRERTAGRTSITTAGAHNIMVEIATHSFPLSLNIAHESLALARCARAPEANAPACSIISLPPSVGKRSSSAHLHLRSRAHVRKRSYRPFAAQNPAHAHPQPPPPTHTH